MPQKLKVMIGRDRHNMEVAYVNDTTKPTEIDTDLFVGRVMVRVRDFAGVTPDGKPPIKDSVYFDGRSRKFAIQIEGRFKTRAGEKPYTGDDIWFGSDFDKLIDFPRAPFNAGMKVAKWIDPATFYEEKTASGRPYIMSPYAACMNTMCAWPAPSRAQDAVVCHRGNVKKGEENDLIPADEIDKEVDSHDAHQAKKKTTRHIKSYWRFLGLKGDPRVDSFLENHAPQLLKDHQVHHDPTSELHETLGQRPRSGSSDEESETFSLGSRHSSMSSTPIGARSSSPTPARSESPVPVFEEDEDDRRPKATATAGTHSKKPSVDVPSKRSSMFSLGGLRSALTTAAAAQPEEEEQYTTADHLDRKHHVEDNAVSTKLDDALGPWRFAKPDTDILEDNSFVFIDHCVDVPKRRKHFCDGHGKNRKTFVYDPDVVYATSFFTPFCDFNTMDLKIGPVAININRFFREMPVRYTLRSARNEEDVFATISFQLVDE